MASRLFNPPAALKIVIDGEPFHHYHSVHRRYTELGGTLSEPAIYARIKKGAKTWAELLAPPAAQQTDAVSYKNRKMLAAKAEMDALLRELDERKRKISQL